MITGLQKALREIIRPASSAVLRRTKGQQETVDKV